MANSVHMTSTNSAGKTITNILSDVNPAAADSDVSTFIKAFASLSDNTLTGAQKVIAEELHVPASLAGTDDAETITCSDYGATIDAAGGDDIINLDGAIACSVNTGEGNNVVSIYGGASDNTIIAGSGKDSIYIYNNAGENNIAYAGDGGILFDVRGTGNKTVVCGNNSDTVQVYQDNPASACYVENFKPMSDLIKTSQVYTRTTITDSTVGGDTVLQVKNTSTGSQSDITLKGVSSGVIHFILYESIYDYTIGGGLSSTSGGFWDNSEPGVLVCGGIDYDTINNTGNFVTIFGGQWKGGFNGNRADSISNSGDYVFIDSDNGLPVDTINNTGNFVTIYSSDSGSKDYIVNSGANASIIYANNIYTSIENAGANATINIKGGNVTNSGSAIVSLGTNRATVSNEGAVTIYGTNNSANCTINNSSAQISVVPYHNNNKFYWINSQDNITLSNGCAVTNSGSNVYIEGTSGANQISIGGNATNCTIFGAATADRITLNGGNHVLYYNGNLSGTDSIEGFHASDTIVVEDTTLIIKTYLYDESDGYASVVFCMNNAPKERMQLIGYTGDKVKIKSADGQYAGLVTLGDTINVTQLSGGW